MSRFISVIIIIIIFCNLAFAATGEAGAPNFWTEFDITFWQTVPFAAFWGYAVAAQFPGIVSWDAVLVFSLLASTLNATAHARRVCKIK